MPKQVTFSIDKKLFDTFPQYRRAVLVTRDVDNTRTSPITDTITIAAKVVKDTVDLEDPRIVAWREAFTALGIKVRDFRPSVDALARRIHNNKPLGSISPLVDVGTVVSLKFVLPAGTHPILADTTTVVLKLATGEETEFSDETHPSEQIPTGEPILLDGSRVATRRWVWRQTSQSRIDRNTRDFYLNIDALEAIDDATLNTAVESSKGLIRQIFGTECRLIILDAANPTQTVEI